MLVRNFQLNNFKPKTLTLNQFKNELTSVSVPELIFVLTLRKRGAVTQEEFQFLCQAVDDAKTVDKLFEFLFQRMKESGAHPPDTPPAAQAQERMDAPGERLEKL